MNRRLLATFEPWADRIAVWFWGHEHNLMIFRRYHGILGRCVGHGARPVKRSTMERLTDYAYAYEDVKLSVSGDGEHLNHGFEVIELGGAGVPASVSYYEVFDDGSAGLLYREEV